MPSIFNKIISGEIPSHKVAENDNHLAFLDIRPLNSGHTLVIPKKETDYIFDLEDQEFADLTLFAKKVAKGIKKAIPCKKVGIMVAGLEVPHVHIHLIPIHAVSDLNFSRAQAADPKDLEEIAAKIKSCL